MSVKRDTTRSSSALLMEPLNHLRKLLVDMRALSSASRTPS